MYGLKLVTFFGTGTGTDTGYFQFLKYGYGTRTLTRTSGYAVGMKKKMAIRGPMKKGIIIGKSFKKKQFFFSYNKKTGQLNSLDGQPVFFGC